MNTLSTPSTPCTSHCFTKTISTLFVLIIGIGIGAFVGYQYSCSMDNKLTTTVQSGVATPQVATTPHGYLMGNYTITDQTTYDEYLNKAGPLTTPYGGKAIVFDLNVERLEGTPKQVMVVVEFPSVAAAQQAYNSPEYSAVKGLRISSTDGNFVIISEGVVPPKK